jgi:hypothetical protein
MLVRAISGVDHRDFQVPGHKISSARRSVSHDEAIRLHGVEIVRSVEEGFAFLEARGFRLEIQGVRAEAGSSRGETEARARGIFKESQHDGFSAQSSELFQRMALDFLKGFRLIENESEFVRGERFKGQEVAKTIGQICARLHARNTAPRLER